MAAAVPKLCTIIFASNQYFRDNLKSNYKFRPLSRPFFLIFDSRYFFYDLAKSSLAAASVKFEWCKQHCFSFFWFAWFQRSKHSKKSLNKAVPPSCFAGEVGEPLLKARSRKDHQYILYVWEQKTAYKETNAFVSILGRQRVVAAGWPLTQKQSSSKNRDLAAGASKDWFRYFASYRNSKYVHDYFLGWTHRNIHNINSCPINTLETLKTNQLFNIARQKVDVSNTS